MPIVRWRPRIQAIEKAIPSHFAPLLLPLAVILTEFIKRGDPSFERRLTGQPRPNVLFEAGMAFGRQPSTTILVQVGKIRAVSDVAGRHIVHLSNSMSSRQQLIAKLKATGLDVDDIGDDWHTEGDFS